MSAEVKCEFIATVLHTFFEYLTYKTSSVPSFYIIIQIVKTPTQKQSTYDQPSNVPRTEKFHT